MPNYGTYDNLSSLEAQAVQPTVVIDGSLYDYCTALSIEDNTGIVPSKCFVRIGGNAFEVSGNITLNAYSWPFRTGSRVQINNGYEPLFLGALRKRRDLGQPNSIVWECWDDRHLLSKIPVRGCLVYDPVDNVVKFISKFINRVNPKGLNNCVGATIPGITGVVPVFTELAETGQGWDDSDTDTTLTVGKVSSWTPSKYLKYLCALANLPAGALAGINADTWRSLAVSQRLSWDYATCNFPSNPNMDKKLPDHTFQAETMLKALGQALEMSATYGLCVVYPGGGKSAINFYPLDNAPYSSSGSPANNPSITLIRGGDIASGGDIRTAYDFELDEDGSDICESALVDGNPVVVEAEFVDDQSGTATLKKSWTTDDQTAFAFMINGGTGAPVTDGSRTYAKYYTRQPDTAANEKWTDMPSALCDGTGVNPYALINSDGARNIARALIPRVWRAYEIDTPHSATILAGVAGKFANLTTYPILNMPRPTLPEQVQYYIDQSGRKTRIQFPIRIQVAYTGSLIPPNAYHDVTANSGVRIDSTGLIWLDGLTDDVGSQQDLIYTGSLTSGPDSVTANNVKINIACELDIRKAQLINQSAGQIDPLESTDLGGGPMLYIDSPEGYHEDHQVGSNPSAILNIPSASTGYPTSVPLTRILRDDTARQITHATRRVKDKKFIKRTSTWAMIGIRPDFRAGMYIEKIQVTGQGGDTDYIIQAPINSVVYDFMAQVTHVGGLVSATAGTGARSGRSFAGNRAGPGAGAGGRGVAGPMGGIGAAFAGAFNGVVGGMQAGFDKGTGTIQQAFDAGVGGMQQGFDKGQNTIQKEFDNTNEVMNSGRLSNTPAEREGRHVQNSAADNLAVLNTMAGTQNRQPNEAADKLHENDEAAKAARANPPAAKPAANAAAQPPAAPAAPASAQAQSNSLRGILDPSPKADMERRQKAAAAAHTPKESDDE